jgi:hypothetical protein
MNNNIYQELIKNQRKNLIGGKTLTLFDLKRISSYLNSSIFTNDCSFWTGYVTNSSTEKHISGFVNFFFKGKKQENSLSQQDSVQMSQESATDNQVEEKDERNPKSDMPNK